MHMHSAELQAALFGDGLAEKDAPFSLNPRKSVVFFDDFHEYIAATRFTLATGADAAAGTVAASDAHGGVAVLTPAGADNNYVFLPSTNELVLPVLGRRIFFQARVKITEANTDDANVFVGLSDTVDATLLGDDGGGPPASYDGIGFHKVDGGTTWVPECSNAATQTTKASTETNATRRSGEWTDLAFKVERFSSDGATAYVDFYVDGECVAYGVALTLSGLAEMHVAVGTKNGGANAEILNVDYIQVVFDR